MTPLSSAMKMAASKRRPQGRCGWALRRQGRLEARKVALLQTKRLYSREVAVTPLDRSDFMIGIGRLVVRPEPMRPLSQQRMFGFDDAST